MTGPVTLGDLIDANKLLCGCYRDCCHEHFAGRPHVTLYMPGHWERRLIEAAKVGP